jgi:GAF domain-containing protein/sensor histidine kinase YesM
MIADGSRVELVHDAPQALPKAAVRPRGRLFRKYIALFVALVGGTLLANGALEIWFSYQEHKTALARIQHEKALGAVTRIEQFIDEITRQIGWTARAQWAPSVLDQRRLEYLQLLRQAPAVTEVAHLDVRGREDLRVSRLAMDVIGSGIDMSGEAKFSEAKARKIWFSPVYFRKESEPYITIALAGTGRDTGVTVAEVNLKFIWDVISRIKVGKAGYAYVVDSRGLLIAHPDIGLVLRKTDLSALPQVAASLASDSGARDAEDIAVVGQDSAGQEVLTANAAIAGVDWRLFVDLPLREAFASIYQSLARTAGLILVGLLLAVGAGVVLARRMVVPIKAMQAGAARIGAGDLEHRLNVRTGDELEALADQFNSMTAQLADSYAGLERTVDERTAELRETLEQQTATAEVLKVISRSRSDLQPVLDTLVETAKHVCAADRAMLFRADGDVYRMAASSTGWRSETLKKFSETTLITPGRDSGAGRTIMERQPVHILDVWADPEYKLGDFARSEGFRTLLGVPLLREGVPIGVITVNRRQIKAFTAREIELLTTFADQAVIAIENTRLLDALQARTDELGRSVEELTATSEILRAIASSPGKLELVLQSVAENAARLCDTDELVIQRVEGDHLRFAANYGTLRRQQVIEGTQVPLKRSTVVGRAILERRAIHVEDITQEVAEYPDSPAHRVGDVRTLLCVPLLREGIGIGVIVALRSEVRPFTEKQIELVKSFADQAVIAIENARLLDALQARTDELGRSVEELTATSDVLRIIASSAKNLQPVLDTLAQTATRLCRGERGFLFRHSPDGYRLSAAFGFSDDEVAYMRSQVIPPGQGTLVGRTALTRQPVRFTDASNDATYHWSEAQQRLGYRSTMGVPLLRNGEPIGVFAVVRNHVEPFTDKQVELLTTFADQAVIAIENTRLLDELQDRTDALGRSVEELKALSEVGRAVSSTLDLKTVLETVVARGAELADAEGCVIYRYRNAARQFRLWHAAGLDPELVETIRATEIRRDETAMGLAVTQRDAMQIADLDTLPAGPLRDISLSAGYRSVLIVPLIGGERVFGALVLMRRHLGTFSDNTVNLLRTFASQSILAIQNARLFREIEEKGRQLEIASQHKSQFLANMSHELRTPLNAILGYAELLLDGLYGDLTPKSQAVLERVQNNGKHLLALINDVLDLAKIEAGQFTLVATDYSIDLMVQSVISATESLARAKGLALRAEVMPGLPTGHGDERRLTQVLLNLVGNAIKFTDRGSVQLAARAENGQFTLLVRDTGPGIAAADQDRIFQEFQQVDNSSTRKKGGTGLGLAISRRIVEMHGGTIGVESVPGHGATFRVDLPINGQDGKEAA